MKYELVVAGVPRARGPKYRSRPRHADRGDVLACRPGSLPVVQVDAPVTPGVDRALQEAARQAFEAGHDLRAICRAVFYRAHQCGLAAAIKVRRDASGAAAVRLQVDLTPLSAQQGRFRFRCGPPVRENLLHTARVPVPAVSGSAHT
ncbi:MAG: hypothetical protein KatS3mg043_2023 [Rhodothermaceae bacterium]|nr:MAG: hypothetical protein KatS3mg043_2023 [Rhodothermaceae bacterium]